MYLNPNRLSIEFQQRIVRWLEANGCRYHIAMEPIIVRGKVAEYVALCRKDRVHQMRVRDGECVPLGRKRLRIRIPLSRVS